jgi:hypothetical protein
MQVAAGAGAGVAAGVGVPEGVGAGVPEGAGVGVAEGAGVAVGSGAASPPPPQATSSKAMNAALGSDVVYLFSGARLVVFMTCLCGFAFYKNTIVYTTTLFRYIHMNENRRAKHYF